MADEILDAADVNAVLTFTDSDGRRWLAGAVLGPLVAEDDTSESLKVAQMPDKALALVSFQVVLP